MEDILNKLGWALLFAFVLMVIIIGVILFQNNFTDQPKITLSAFYFIISVIFLVSGIYFRNLSKKI